MSLPTAALAYKRVTFVNKMADNSGSGAWIDISVWRPNLENGWFYLGQGASIVNDAPPGVIVSALESDALRDVASWEPVWNDAGSESPRDYSLWRGVPPNSDYAVLGGIFSTNPGWAPPDSAQTYGIKAIRRDLLTSGPTVKIWDESGTGAINEGSMWEVGSTKDVQTTMMIPMPSHLPPPQDVALALDPNQVLDVTPSSATEGEATSSESLKL
ncbi:FDS protein [Hymenopellis radicata]|nr:FDS protein [Hymenopellis radicata]